MHKGLGAKATLLIQNGTLKHGDALVFDQYWGYVKTMHDENGKTVMEAGPSTPIEITGLSGLPSAGQEFIVVANDKEAREIAEARAEKIQIAKQQRRPVSLESLLTESKESPKKVLNVILRADVQGSLEALKTALLKIESEKAEVQVIFSGVGEISESDVQLAAASKAVIMGFHTKVESHAESLIKQYGVQVHLHDVIYHAVDTTKVLLAGTLDMLVEEVKKGKADVLATFKSSQHGLIAGCLVTEGVISRNNHVRIFRDGVEIWKGSISSLKRLKDDVKEVRSGLECGILVSSNDIKEGDKIEAFENVYIKQEL
jgi:translation initiation factor IF-2